ncbi:hypothetical protein PMAYCL1PPCAC_17193 [Pristionchus mayeri]|uniref:Phosphatase n=1 Tax=Pristionchus mayeri TaxID=1317129 RepID=A0AAN5CM64_9BILA|nr:hypothetical protein PMAYCL1PPCAC_17178 [Pristionchus mayeri]GMR46993.1 hypothetical protein PMAYCL1PPCAC_17188 [Pristionchus mayeri]GMR46998.1 hypothetical protein PMAYCL1PPCAC_17193 [Pristionchus mayeri]
MRTLSRMLGILVVEKDDFNLTMPEWVTDRFYADLTQANNEGEDFVDGAAGFGLSEDTELLRLRGGFILKEFVKNFKDVINNSTTTRYFAYSGHDSTERALLLTLGLKNATVGPGNPDYTSVIACELWKRVEEYYVKTSLKN